MEELAAFIEARLAEDEEVAQAAAIANPGPAAHHWSAEQVDDRSPWTGLWGKAWGVLPERVRGPVLARTMDIQPTVSAHIARHDPARVLREVEAKRSIVKTHRWHGPDFCGEDRFCPLLVAMASVWSDHSDFKAEWNVVPGE